jgi:hypothetical protein
MRSFKLRILANNEAGNWASWPEKIAAIKAFYAPVCELDITLIPTKLTPTFSPEAPISGSAATYIVDPAWYAANVTPLADGANIIMFAVPPTDHPGVITYMGFEAGHPIGPWQTTVFADETSHTYVNDIADQGETAVVYATHELSHVFYAMLAKTDKTHLYFFAGTPEKVLADFDFDEQELSWYQQAIADLEQIIADYKARKTGPPVEPTASTQSSQNGTPAPQLSGPTEPAFPPKIVAWADLIGKEEGGKPEHHNPGNLKYSSLTASWGGMKGPAASDGGYLAVFKDEQTGHAALCNFLVLGCEDQLIAFHAPEARTLAGFTKIYAGNPPQGYTNAIVAGMGGDPNIQISTFLA